MDLGSIKHEHFADLKTHTRNAQGRRKRRKSKGPEEKEGAQKGRPPESLGGTGPEGATCIQKEDDSETCDSETPGP